jgi:hypothetical protein
VFISYLLVPRDRPRRISEGPVGAEASGDFIPYDRLLRTVPEGRRIAMALVAKSPD